MKKNFDLRIEDLQVVDGKVVINSEELANAVMEENVDFSEEEAEGFKLFGNCVCGGNAPKQ